ncbi:hypothetical protein AS4_06500 [Acinetobacter guillouiae]|uniref:hypothetical protein n=1 Tax=Acinetobacter guillouiae TaxID=106649 RepID=UPI0004EF68CF|nr:hypothetical protein [Acinetobacter guillouiae]BAP35590.1 hypothetical protein AS4_06500 [Acinetobacter guillouiae]
MKFIFEQIFYEIRNSALARISFYYVLAMIILISATFFFSKFYPDIFYSNYKIFRWIFYIASGITATLLFFNYLNISSFNTSFLENEVHSLSKKVNQLANKTNEVADNSINNIITAEEKNLILSKIQLNIENGLTNEYFKKLQDNLKKNNIEDEIQENIIKSIARLNIETLSLNKRGNVNLFIGLILSIIGLAILGAAIHNYYPPKNLTELFIEITPRTVFVILVEVFSYFFLNLYRKSLDEIKYYQNEITNLEAKYLSLKVSISLNNHKIIGNILDNLIKTERNFILENDQTTIELEKERINSNNTNNTLKTIKDIFKSRE